MNGRTLSIVFGLLRNSTIFCCAKKLGLEQCSQKAPGNDEKLKQRPYCSQTPAHPTGPQIEGNVSYFEIHWWATAIWWKFCSNGKYLDIPPRREIDAVKGSRKNQAAFSAAAECVGIAAWEVPKRWQIS